MSEKEPSHQSQWKRRERRCSRHWSIDSPIACGEEHRDAGCTPCSPWRTPMEQISTLQLWRTPHRSRQMSLEGRCSPIRALIGASSWQDLRPVERSPHWIRFSGRKCGLQGTQAETIHSWRNKSFTLPPISHNFPLLCLSQVEAYPKVLLR